MTSASIDLLVRRRSAKARTLIEPGPTESELAQILTAGLRVPDHGKLSPWRIQVVDTAGRRVLASICEDVFASEHPEVAQSVLDVERCRPLHAPVLLVVSSRLDRSGRIPEIEQLLSGGALCQNVLNAAHALGYAAQWLTGWPAYSDRVKRTLGIPVEEYVLGWIHIGTASVEVAERSRAGISDVVTVWSGPPANEP